MEKSKIPTADEIIDKRSLHEYYYPNGDFKKKKIHDINCPFCHYEEGVIDAMVEFAKIHVKLALENVANNPEMSKESILSSYPEKLIE